MSVYRSTPVDQTPAISLSRWSVYRIPHERGPTDHFVGYNDTEMEGRASSPIKEFDRLTGRGMTASGRIYELTGAPGKDSDGEYVWSHWKYINKVFDADVEDVTMEYLNANTPVP